MYANEPYDWVDDESMSADLTLRRFDALEPIEVTGPPSHKPIYIGGNAMHDIIINDCYCCEPRP